MSFRRSVLIPCVAIVLTPLISGCFNVGWGGRAPGSVNVSPFGGNVNVGFPGGGVNVSAGPGGAGVNVGFPGGGVNVNAGAFGGGVSVAARGFNMNFGFPGRTFGYVEDGPPLRSAAALFPPKATVPYAPPVPVKPAAVAGITPPPPAPALAGAMSAPEPQPVPADPGGSAMPAAAARESVEAFDDLRSR